MSRCNLQFSDYQEVIEKSILNEPTVYDSSPKILLIDSDSILYTSIYNPDRVENQTEEEILLDIEECKFRLNKKIQEIVLNVEKWYNIQKTLFFVKGKNNFRYKLYPEYKANRPKKHPFIDILYKYVINELNWVEAPDGMEADDAIYTAWQIDPYNNIIATVDKDIKSSCYGLFYNYRSYSNVLGEFYTVTEKESLYNFCTQLIIGDNADNVIGFCPKKGEKYAKKTLNINDNIFSYKRKLLKTYIDAWKGDVKLAKEKLRICYKLLKLHNIEDIKKIK